MSDPSSRTNHSRDRHRLLRHGSRMLVVACLVGTLAACGGNGQVDASIRDKPCDLLPADAVASAFSMSADDIKTRRAMTGYCSLDGEHGDQRLEAMINLNSVAEDSDMAAARFARATRNRSAEEIQEALRKVTEKMNDDGKSKRAGKMLGALFGKDGITFTDVTGVGDQARIDKRGALHVRSGNLLFTVSGTFESGSGEPVSDRETAVRLANIIIAAMKG